MKKSEDPQRDYNSSWGEHECPHVLAILPQLSRQKSWTLYKDDYHLSISCRCMKLKPNALIKEIYSELKDGTFSLQSEVSSFQVYLLLMQPTEYT